MPLTFKQVAGAGDVMANNRHILQFPRLPTGVDGNILTIRHTSVSLPSWETGQIIAKIYGWSIAFSGRRNNPNTMSVEFVETTGGPTTKTLLSWQAMAAGFKSPSGVNKQKYAIGCELTAYDTTGKKALKCKLYNVWPHIIKLGDFEEDTGALHVSCEFSVDAVDVVDLTYTEGGLDRSAGFDYINSSSSYSATVSADTTTTGFLSSNGFVSFGALQASFSL